MPSGSLGPYENPLLSGMFGNFQQAAMGHLDTEQLWQQLRLDAGSWRAQAQGTLGSMTEQELIESGRQILSEQGIGAAHVSAYRGVAGQWLKARGNLGNLDLGEQVQGGEIFTPPWSLTDAEGVPARYRVRVSWQATGPEGEVTQKWSSYELTNPITSLQDVFDQARSMAVENDSDRILFSGGEPEITDYEIEQV